MTHTEIEITAELVRELLREQCPDLAELPLRLGALGWANQVWRLGEELAVRVPWVTSNAEFDVLKEHRWLPELVAAGLPLPVPVPQRLGAPGERFPRPWLVTTWVWGEPADHSPVTRGAESAAALAAFLTALHRPAPEGAPQVAHRGGPLSALTGHVEQQIVQAVEVDLLEDPDAVRAVWHDAASAPVWEGPPVWLHGDLHPANVVTADGVLSGVIDFGDLSTGDPACDLAAPWILLPAADFAAFHAAYTPSVPLDPFTLRRARGWATLRALVGLLVGDAGVHGRAGGKATWGPPSRTSLDRLLATAT